MNTAPFKPNHTTILTIRIPLSVRRRGGRRLVVTPDGSAFGRSRAHVDDAIINALGRSFRWNKLLESGRYASIEELAAAERINQSYLGRVLRLSLLAPTIVEDLLDGRSTNLTLAKLLRPFPAGWSEQETWAAQTLEEAEAGQEGATRDDLLHRICRRHFGGQTPASRVLPTRRRAIVAET